jgi:16S rRNA C1402 (ribose-2'-O) methylase RsmI
VHLHDRREPRGEYTLVIRAADQDRIGHPTHNDAMLRAEFTSLVDAGATPRAAVRLLAQRYSLSSRHVYSVVHQTASE